MLANFPAAATLPAVDLNRARKFYEGTLGLKVQEADEFGFRVDCGRGTQIYLYKRGPTKADNTAVGFRVDDLEKEVAELKQKGVKFEEYDFPGLKTVNSIAVMGGEKAAWFKDTEGNIIGVSTRAKK
jgi:catechol 2,3-dioxygenase-like lactoylglutathione lyase family enzyme